MRLNGDLAYRAEIDSPRDQQHGQVKELTAAVPLQRYLCVYSPALCAAADVGGHVALVRRVVRLRTPLRFRNGEQHG